MEKTGLQNKIVRNLSRSWGTHQLAHETPEMKGHHASLAETLSLLKQVKATKDINQALGVEEVMLRQELALYSNSQEQRDSINAAIRQVQEAKDSLSVVQDHKGYQLTAKTYGAKEKEAGLPLDSFRKFLRSHNTRLSNEKTGRRSKPEKDILDERKGILSMAREVYIGMQRKALGMEAPNKSRSLGR